MSRVDAPIPVHERALRIILPAQHAGEELGTRSIGLGNK